MPVLLDFVRDLRDPSELGKTLLQDARSARHIYGDIPLTEIYDVHVSKLHIPDYNSSETLGTYTPKEYLEELSQRDDLYAKSTLEAIKAGTKPTQDPSGE